MSDERVSRAAIVTGSDSGIGRATAVALADAGFDIGVTWYSDEAGAEETARLVRALGRRVEVRRLDLGEPPAAAAVIDEVSAALGRLQVFVNNAAVDHRAGVLEERLADWSRVITVDLTGPFACAQAAARRMVQQRTEGRIVNVTSVHEHVPARRGGAYCAAKTALGMLTKVMALDLVEHGITVNSIAPGHVATPMTGHRGEQTTAVLRPEIPIGRAADPREIGAAVAYVCSPAAAYTTGTSLIVDGGLVLAGVLPLQRALEGRRRAQDRDRGGSVIQPVAPSGDPG